MAIRQPKVNKIVTIKGIGNVQALGGIGLPIERPQLLSEDTILAIINEGFEVNEYQPVLGIEKRLDRLNYNKLGLFSSELNSRKVYAIEEDTKADNKPKVDKTEKIVPINPNASVIANQVKIANEQEEKFPIKSEPMVNDSLPNNESLSLKIGDTTKPEIQNPPIQDTPIDKEEDKDNLFLSQDRTKDKVEKAKKRY